jgi:Tol biopolymer transport system component
VQSGCQNTRLTKAGSLGQNCLGYYIIRHCITSTSRFHFMIGNQENTMFLKGSAVILAVFLGLVLALFGGCTWLPNLAQYLTRPSPPVLSTPADESIVPLPYIKLEWQSSPGANSYGLQVSANSDFTSVVDEQTGIADTYQPVSGLVINTTYYWRVNASNVIGTSTWSQSWKFTTSALQLDKIAFSSNRTGIWDIYVMSRYGANQTEITDKITGDFNTSIDDISISWSPDGTKFAFDSRSRGKFDVYTADSDGSNVSIFTTDPSHDCFPAWSPDGSQIAFASNRDDNFEIYVKNSDGSGKRRLTNNAAADLFPSWSPDGTKIAFTSDRDGNDEIYVMNSDGSDPTRLTENIAAGLYPSWSPDGAKIAFTSDRDGNNEIYVMNSDGSNQTRLTHNPAQDETPKWSPDGTEIVFTSNRDGNFQIYIMNADGSNQTRITNNSADDRWPAWR